MRAIICEAYGTADNLRLEDVEKPSPGANDVLVRVFAVSINAWDYEILTGRPVEYRLIHGLLKPRERLLHGCDIAGQVEAVGEAVEGFSVGDKVFGDLSEAGWGAYADYVSAAADNLALMPENMSFTDAACLSHGGNLAVQGLIDHGRIQPGQKVLINGGGGSTGTLAIQIAKTIDVEVTAVDRGNKLETMLRLGADHVMDYSKEDFSLISQQFDLIFDVQTTRSYADYARALRPQGVYVTVGGKTSKILRVLFRGMFSRHHTMRMVAYKANKDSAFLKELYMAGKLKPVIDSTFPLQETAEAFRYFGTGDFKGKVLVDTGASV